MEGVLTIFCFMRLSSHLCLLELHMRCMYCNVLFFINNNNNNNYYFFVFVLLCSVLLGMAVFGHQRRRTHIHVGTTLLHAPTLDLKGTV
jgi:hypothetical protein